MNEHRKRDNVIRLFGDQPEKRSNARRAGRNGRAAPPVRAPSPPPHPLDEYVAFLRERDFISEKERTKLTAALAPLRARFAGLSTVQRVRDEMRAADATVDSLRRKEMAVWQDRSVFPWFDLDKAIDGFTLNPEQVGERVRFLNEAARAAQRRCIDPELDNAELFFWIILRMYRVHAESAPEDAVAPPEPSTPPRASWRDRLWPWGKKET